jgi:hypothetical protein
MVDEDFTVDLHLNKVCMPFCLFPLQNLHNVKRILVFLGYTCCDV